MKAYVSGAVYLPRKFFESRDLESDLTIKYYKMGEPDPLYVEAFQHEGKYVAVPRDYGLQLIADHGLGFEDRMSDGQDMDYPKVVKHTGAYAYQKDFVNLILETCNESNDFLISAATGKGKTVMSLSVFQKLGVNAIVVVDQQNLLDQWVDRAKTVLGLTDDQIGIVQGGRADYEGKHVTIAMMQTLVSRKYSESFYDYFGVVVFDEAHTAGAPTFSRALMMFSARTRFGVSATIERRDALQTLLTHNLGAVRAELKDKHDTSYVYYVENSSIYSWYANVSPKTGRMLSEVAEDTDRNLVLATAAKWLYDSGRTVLVLSDRIEQLEALQVLLSCMGVPEDESAVYTGYHTVWAYRKNPRPLRKPMDYVRGTEFTPVILTPVKKKLSKKTKAEMLGSTPAKIKILLATFGMFAKGVDVPELSGGVDATPRARAEQAHGRILRVRDGKLVPIWVTLRDVNSYRNDHQFAQRVKDYAASSAEIYRWRIGKGLRRIDVDDLVREARQNVARLKKLRIETSLDGNNTLVTPP
jgi:superfamily II DNA or RNA helicase